MVRIVEMSSNRESDVSAVFARILVGFGKHRYAEETKAENQIISHATIEPAVHTAALKAETGVEISARTGRPKRKYTRRDMRAET